jgi:hypothetical protein
MGLGSEIRDPEKTYSGFRNPDPGVKKAPDPGSRIWIRNTGLNQRTKGKNLYSDHRINNTLKPKLLSTINLFIRFFHEF